MRPASDFAKALRDGCAPVVLVHVEHPDGDGYFWEGVRDLEYDGKTWKGAGLVGNISATRKSADLRIDEVRFTLAALNPEEVSKLSDDIRNRVATIYLAAMNEAQRVVAIYQMDEVRLDYQIDKFAADRSATIEVVGESGFWTLERSTDAAYSQEEQALLFPDDTGLSLIPALRNKDIAWTLT